jgi:trehalose 6-phosphate synthase/phosphatase
MSGRQPEELDRLFKRVPNLGLIAENGCFIKEFGYSKWKEMPDPEKMRAWQESVEGTMRYYQERTPGSWIEKRHCSLIFHYKDADDFESASRQAGDCASHINDACEKQRVRAIPVDGTFILPNPLLDQLLTRNRRSNR